MAESRAPRTAVITDWRIRDESDLPDIPPGGEYECVIAPQKFVVLRQIIVRGPRVDVPIVGGKFLHLVGLQIGVVPDVPFELENVDGEIRRYRPKDLDVRFLDRLLLKAGAAAAGSNMIAISPGLEVRLQLRNEGDAPAKPHAALLVHEEAS